MPFHLTAGGGLGFLVRGHGHEGEASGLSSQFVLYEDGFADGAGFGEEVLEIVLGGVEGEIPDVEFGCHMVCFCVVGESLRLFPVIGFQIATESLRLSPLLTQLAIYQRPKGL